MNTLIMYGSHYGTAKKYAEKFSEMTNFSAISYEKVKNIEDYDQIVYFGALYAGGVKGLKSIVKRLPNKIKLIIVTVGLADPSDRENMQNIRKAIQRQVPERIFGTTTIFHLRGGIDYQKLSFKHKTMMTLLYNKARGIPDAEKTAEIKAMIETFNSTVNFVDYTSLNQISEAMK